MFLISVIIPVYNTEIYLRQAIESVVQQTVGFEDNIELILVNNATEDGSGEICIECKNKYPSNVKYIILEENKGPSGARNAGLSVATGEFINYLDSDDLWEADAFEHFLCSIQKYKEQNHIFIGRLRHFDSIDRWHILDWRFGEVEFDKEIDIYSKPQFIQLHLCSALISKELAKKYSHDESVYNAEDMQYLNKLILEQGGYILCKSPVYLYRSRPSGNSALQTVNRSIRWYENTVKDVYQYFIDYSKRAYGEVIRYIQYLIMHELQWRLGGEIDCEKLDKDKYKNSISNLLKDIDEDIIINNKVLWKERKVYALCLKYDLRLNSIESDNLFKKHFKIEEGLYIKSINMVEGKLHILGFIRYPYRVEGQLYMCTDNWNKEIIFDGENPFSDVVSMEEIIAHGKRFFISYPIKDEKKFYFKLNLQNEEEIILKLNLFRNTRISGEYIEIDENQICIK